MDEDTDEGGPGPNDRKGNSSLDDVPEEEEEPLQQNGQEEHRERSDTASSTEPQQQAALRELYMHEFLALLSCFAMPAVSAYLLHYIRVQLSRPSEGLVSNYNLTIFLLVSELRAFSHALKLVQSRTLHLQRVMHGNPFASPTSTGAKMEDMVERLSRLEARSMAEEFVREHNSEPSAEQDPMRPEQKAAMTRDVRGAIQPELDALNRAVRRYEKKATLLQLQTDSRFSMLEARMDDAIALAAVAAKNSGSKNIFVRTAESLVSLILLPFNALLQLIALPFRSLATLFTFSKQRPAAAKHPRSQRLGRPSSRATYGPERVPTRVAKR